MMPNHFHAMVRAVHMNCSDFMGSFKAEPVLDDEAMVERMRYILCNPVAAGLVRTPGEWPGVTSWDAQMSDEEAVEGRFILKKDGRRLEREHPDLTLEEARKSYTLKLARLPGWEGLDQEAYRRRLRELVEGHCRELVGAIEAQGRTILSAEGVKRQRWTQRARSTNDSDLLRPIERKSLRVASLLTQRQPQKWLILLSFLKWAAPYHRVLARNYRDVINNETLRNVKIIRKMFH